LAKLVRLFRRQIGAVAVALFDRLRLYPVGLSLAVFNFSSSLFVFCLVFFPYLFLLCSLFITRDVAAWSTDGSLIFSSPNIVEASQLNQPRIPDAFGFKAQVTLDYYRELLTYYERCISELKHDVNIKQLAPDYIEACNRKYADKIGCINEQITF
jgi:hypothetical protein